MAKTLLELAKEIRVYRRGLVPKEEELQLTEAWLNGEIQLVQVMKALKTRSGSVYATLALCARELWKRNKAKGAD